MAKEKFNLEDLVDINEVAILLKNKVSISTLRKMCMRKEIPFYKIGRKVLFYKPEIAKWIQANRGA
jgi:excisionase family DNA binding protein